MHKDDETETPILKVLCVWQTLITSHKDMERAILLLEGLDLAAIVPPVSESVSPALLESMKQGQDVEVCVRMRVC
jgi:hypothetical protein